MTNNLAIKKPSKEKSTDFLNHGLLIIDIGNDCVKAMYRTPASKEFDKVIFPSYVAQVSEGNSDCIQLSNDAFYLVGTQATEVNQSCRTGSDREGKVLNARVLMLYSLRLLTGFTIDPLNVDVIFTSPSNKQYGSDITAQLMGSHYVRIPSDAEVIDSKEHHLSVVVHTALSQLEGFQASDLVKDSIKDDSAYLLDIGGGTCLVTKFSKTGRIASRDAFNNKGVYSLAESLRQSEALTKWLPKLPTVDEVTEFMFTTKDKDAQETIINELKRIIAPVLASIPTGSQVFICGGGGGIKGIAAIGKPVSKNPQWANIEAIASHAGKLLANSRGTK